MGQGSIRPTAGRGNERLGRYQLVRKLFDGSLGDLWWGLVAEGDGEGDHVWVRRVSLSESIDDDAARGLVEAAREGQKLRGKGLHPVRDVLRTETEIAIVSDAVEGETLRSILWRAGIKRQPIPPSVALRIGLDLLGAIGELRNARSHGPREVAGVGADNVVVTVEGQALLLEPIVSGFAVGHSPWAQDPKLACYRAPETLRETTKFDARADLFSAAVLLWEMLRNRPLFGGARFEAVERSLAQGSIGRVDSLRPPGSEAISKALADVVGRALERDPIGRPSSLEDFAREVEKAADAVAPPAAVGAFVERAAAESLKQQRSLSGEERFHEAETIELRVPLSSNPPPGRPAPPPGRPVTDPPDGQKRSGATAAGSGASARGSAAEAGVPNFGALFGAPTATGSAPGDEKNAASSSPSEGPSAGPPEPAGDTDASGSSLESPDETDEAGAGVAAAADRAVSDDDEDAAGVLEAGAEPPSGRPQEAAKTDGDADEAADESEPLASTAGPAGEAADGSSYRPPIEGSGGRKLWLVLAAAVLLGLLVWLVGPCSGGGTDTVRTGEPATSFAAPSSPDSSASAAPEPSASASAADVEDAGALDAADGGNDAAGGDAATADAEPADTASPAPTGKPKSGGRGKAKPKGRYLPGSL